MPPNFLNQIVHQGKLFLTLSLPVQNPTKPGPSTTQSKKKKQTVLQRTSYSVLYLDGRLECYPGDPFSVGSRYEASKATQVLYLCPGTGWATVELSFEEPGQLPDDSLSFAIRRKALPSITPSLQHLGLDVEVMGLPSTSSPNGKDSKDRKTNLRDLFRSKRSKSIGGARVSPSINLLESLPPPLPSASLESNSDDSVSQSFAAFKSQAPTPEYHLFNQSLPNPLVFSVDSLLARHSWMKAFRRVLVEAEPVSQPSPLPPSNDPTRRLATYDSFPLSDSPSTTATPDPSSIHLSLTQHPSPHMVLSSANETGHLLLNHSCSLSSINHDPMPHAKSPYGIRKASAPDPFKYPKYAPPTPTPRTFSTPAIHHLASPFASSPTGAPIQEAAAAVPDWIRSVRSADQKKMQAGLPSDTSSDLTRPVADIKRSATVYSTVSSQASLPTSPSLSGSDALAVASHEKRGTFGSLVNKPISANPLRSISTSLVSNLRRNVYSNENLHTETFSPNRVVKRLEDDSSSRSSDAPVSNRGYSLDTGSSEGGEVGQCKEKGLRFLKMSKRRVSSLVEKSGGDSLTHAAGAPPVLSGPSPLFRHNSNSSRAVMPDSFTCPGDPTSYSVTSPHQGGLTREQKHGSPTHPLYHGRTANDVCAITQTPHSKQSFTDWLSSAAGQGPDTVFLNPDSTTPQVSFSSSARNVKVVLGPVRERASYDASLTSLAPCDAKGSSDHSSFTSPSEEGHGSSSLSSSVSGEISSHHQKPNFPIFKSLHKALSNHKPVPTPLAPSRSDMTLNSLDVRDVTLSVNEKWITNHIVPPQELLHQLHASDEPLSVAEEVDQVAKNNANFLKSLNDNQQKQVRNKLQLSLNVLPLHSDTHLRPRPHALETTQRPSTAVPTVRGSGASNSPAMTSLPVPARRRIRQNSASASSSTGDGFNASALIKDSSRRMATGTRKVCRPLTPDRPIPELAAECDESNEQKENESESESQTLFTKPIGSCTNALTPTYKSTFGQKILINGADLQLRRGSQSTLKGLDHLAL